MNFRLQTAWKPSCVPVSWTSTYWLTGGWGDRPVDIPSPRSFPCSLIGMLVVLDELLEDIFDERV